MPRIGLSCCLRPLSWIPSGPQHAAYVAALALVVIQVGIGIILKASQKDGGYAFSPSASVTISEFFKMLLSAIFFYNECRQRAADGINPSTRGLGGRLGYAELPVSERERERRNSVEEKEREEGLNEASNGSAARKHVGPLPRLSANAYWSYVRGEVPKDSQYGFAKLALFYVLINNSIFVLYKLADPGTVQLVRSGVTFITAFVMMVTLRSKISKIQWIAIILQICGLMTTQYDPTKGTAYPFRTYFLILFQTFLSASSGVYNQALLKSDESSLHADNLVLYAAGASFNLLSHVVVRVLKADEPGFFEGYNSFGAIMVIVNNVFIGLAITAVYKYADAVVKCFATAVATGILLYISPLLFGTHLGFLVVPGTIVVFVASWLYMDNPPPKREPLSPPSGEPQKLSLFGKLVAVTKLHNKSFLGTATFFTVMAVAFLTMIETTLPGNTPPTPKPHRPHVPSTSLPASGDGPPIESPLKNTMAMIRWNSAHPERIPLLMKYAPFFHTVHISMPGMLPSQPKDFHDLTHDQWPGSFLVYEQVAHTMKLILDEHPDIDGLMYYHFDAWLHPLAFAEMNPYNIWFLNTVDVAPPSGGGPNFMCMADTKDYNWWGWGADIHKAALAASDVVDNFGLGYNITKGEWCIGWSDIYYIPRRFFADFIFLAEIFNNFGVFHEVAIPTIVTIINRSRRRNPHTPVLEQIGDCWGSCCSSNPTSRQVLWHRCGHRLDYRKEDVVNTFFDALDDQAALIGRPLPSTQYALERKLDDVFNKTILEALNKGDVDGVKPLQEDGLEDDERAERWKEERKVEGMKDAPKS